MLRLTIALLSACAEVVDNMRRRPEASFRDITGLSADKLEILVARQARLYAPEAGLPDMQAIRDLWGLTPRSNSDDEEDSRGVIKGTRTYPIPSADEGLNRGQGINPDSL